MFRSFIHFEFIFVYGVRKWPRFIFLHVAAHFPSTICWRDCLYSIGYSFLLCQRLVGHTFVGLFWVLYSVPLIWVFLCQYHTVLIRALSYSLKSGIVMPPALVFFFRIALTIQGLFWFHTNFRIVCSSSVKNAGVILMGISLNMQIALGSIDILTIFVLPIHEHGTFFHFFVSSSISFINTL